MDVFFFFDRARARFSVMDVFEGFSEEHVSRCTHEFPHPLPGAI